MTGLADNVTPESGLPPTAAVLGRLAQAATALSRARTLDEAVQALLGSGLRVVKGSRGAVVLLDATRSRLDVVAQVGYSDEVMAQWGSFPVDAKTPLAEAVRTGKTVLVPDVETLRDRYDIAPSDEEPHALIAVPLLDGNDPIGAWGLRIDTGGPGLSLGEAAAASGLVGDLASARMSEAVLFDGLQRQVDQLQGALDSRVMLEQAKGVLSERHRLTPDEAFQRLRQHARATGTRLHDLAAEVVAGRIDPLASH